MKQKSAVVVGGCGFIGTHCVKRLLLEGYRVLCIDNLSRPTAQANLNWMRHCHLWPAEHFVFALTDVRHSQELVNVVREHIKQHGKPEIVMHLAAQVAVTLSVTAPRHDFEVNVLGTFNVLELVRSLCPEAAVIFSSTNKVYGCLKNLEVRELKKRYEFKNLPDGVSSRQPLDFCSPYGCSKGAADQYVRDYARIYGLRTLVFRQSCIYGTRQFGQEDQGWVSWFVIASLLNRKTTIYGTGKQLRDLLWIDDLLDAYWSAWRSGISGEIFNIGGGPKNTLSLLELLDMLKGLAPELLSSSAWEWGRERPGDQPVYVSDISELRKRLNWAPIVSPRKGVETLWAWANNNREEIERLLPATSVVGRRVQKVPSSDCLDLRKQCSRFAQIVATLGPMGIPGSEEAGTVRCANGGPAQ
jgi:CDP-paratose 2-epimerase